MTRRPVRPAVPTPSPVPLPVRAVVSAIALVAAILTPVVLLVAAAPAGAAAPATPPAPICGSPVLVGPASPPDGAVVVPAGFNDTATMSTPGATYWFAPGVHTLSPTDPDDIIKAGAGATFIGGPGAILDGQHFTKYAIGGKFINDVTVRYLTVQNFGVPGGDFNFAIVNHDSGAGWTMEYNTVTQNAGAGILLGPTNVARFNCLTNNGQYGFNVFNKTGVFNITIDQNEVAFNNADDWESRSPGCGCAGGDKFWDTHGAVVTNNWIHDNHGPGLYIDTDNTHIQIEGNYIENNDGEGIFYEISYNGRIANNTLRRNAIVKGKAFAARGDNFPVPAIYISESGGDARVDGGVYSNFEITGNVLVDNWGGIALFESGDRFCGSPGNAAGFCTLGGAGSLSTCVQGTISTQPYKSDCRWKTKNLAVHDNELHINRAAIGCVLPEACGQQALLATPGTAPSWSPYLGTAVVDMVTFNQNNQFFNNHYFGDWVFTPRDIGIFKTLAQWQAAPYNLDAGSTLIGNPPTNSLLDAATSTMEGSIGHWAPWFGASVGQSTAQASTGTGSLEVVTGGQFWGANLNNDPGFPATPGQKNLSFAGLGGAGSNAGMKATLTVWWRDASGANLQVDTLVLASLGGAWTQAAKTVTAPPGTAYVSVGLSNGTGAAGAHVYFDDVVVSDAPPPPPGGALDTATATLEASSGRWAPWFGATVARTTAQAHTGSASLQVNVGGQFWGANLNNDPGFTATPGPKNVSFWGLAGAGAGSGSAATLSVYWRDASGANIEVDTLTVPALSSTWTQGLAGFQAPTGTAKVSVSVASGTGVAGSVLYFDDFAVADGVGPPPPPPPGGLLDPDTSSVEGSDGHWSSWFSADASRSTGQAHGGSASLRVAITARYGWGANLDNDPGFAAAAGPKTVSFWGLAGAGSAGGLGATLTVYWRSAAGANLQVDTVTIPSLSSSWTQGTASLDAPTGTAKVSVSLSNPSGGPGDTLFFDDVVVANA